MMRSTRLLIVLWLLVAVPHLRASPPSGEPAGRRSASATRSPALEEAVSTLTTEVESALRRGDDPPRAQSDYFYGQVEIPPAAVVAALRRTISADPRVAAYVMWQLLSALPEELDEQTAGELLAVYRAAPAPLPRLGIDPRQREELDRLISGASEADEPALAEQFEQLVERVARENRPILACRDALFARLPPTYETIAAGLDDAAARLSAGADGAEHVRNVCKAIPQWAPQATAEQLRAVERALGQLERRKGQPYYNRVYWSTSYGRMAFSKSRGSLASVSQLEEARDYLRERIRNPVEPLKLKEEW